RTRPPRQRPAAASWARTSTSGGDDPTTVSQAGAPRPRRPDTASPPRATGPRRPRAGSPKSPPAEPRRLLRPTPCRFARTNSPPTAPGTPTPPAVPPGPGGAPDASAGGGPGPPSETGLRSLAYPSCRNLCAAERPRSAAAAAPVSYEVPGTDTAAATCCRRWFGPEATY